MGFGRKLTEKAGGLFRFSPSEGRGILMLLPLLAVAGLIIHGIGRPGSDPEFLSTADSLLTAAPLAEVPEGGGTHELFFFDPNTVTLEELCRLGFELRTAASIIKYRDGGKVFEVPEDLAMCYGVKLEQYLAVEPFIVIDDAYRRKPRGRQYPVREPADRTPAQGVIKASALFYPNEADEEGFMAIGFTAAQARIIVNYRNSVGGFTSAEQFGRCYAVSDDALRALEPFMVFKSAEPSSEITVDELPGTIPAVVFPVEINGADSATLRAVSGIGELLVVRIMEYRARLCGFHREEQLAEIKGMTQANYERIIQQITVDSCKIVKIDINFAPHKQLVERLEKHPYTTSRAAGKLLSVRQLKGGWSNTRELIEDKILTKEEAEKLAPYLLFRPLGDN